jgi:hypothetical protein
VHGHGTGELRSWLATWPVLTLRFETARYAVVHEQQNAELDAVRDLLWQTKHVLVGDGLELDGLHDRNPVAKDVIEDAG